MTLGEALAEGKVWDAMPLSIRHLIIHRAGLDASGEREFIAFRSWQRLPIDVQARLLAIDWRYLKGVYGAENS